MEELVPSKLGTKEHWNSVYTNELQNFEYNPEDKGEVWFGEDSAEKMVDWVYENVPKDARIGDIGCGNGHLLFSLYDLGYQNILGFDYSEQSVQLCRNIGKIEGKPVEFVTADFLCKEEIPKLGSFDILLDKGTLDAISLASRNGDSLPADSYVDACFNVLNPNGILLITSCNWTEDELRLRFTPKFTVHSKINYPKFKFGGVEGQTITTLAFSK